MAEFPGEWDAYDEEAPFSRTATGQLIRIDQVTEKDAEQLIEVSVDGVLRSVAAARKLLDSQGVVVRGNDGNPLFRATTIYDVVAEHANSLQIEHPVPTLCHRDHLPPIGVCRVCMVSAKPANGRPKLVPSCVQRVEDGMTVDTLRSKDAKTKDRIASRIRTILELLASDHLPESQREVSHNELQILVERFGADVNKFANSTCDRGVDPSNHMINVDHNQCIMCGRCQRSCSWVKEYRIIGRSGKGYASSIGFDLGQLEFDRETEMGSSKCHECGECATNCPTGALEFHDGFITNQMEKVSQSSGIAMDELIRPHELANIEFGRFGCLFSYLPHKFLQLNAGAISRRLLKPKDVLCREGEHGATAYLIKSGTLEVRLDTKPGSVVNKSKSGVLGFLGLLTPNLRSRSEDGDGRRPRLADLGGEEYLGEPILRTQDDLILGEMACMNRYPRSATIVARTDCEIYEIRRNVLDVLRRTPRIREFLESLYRERALQTHLTKLALFKALDSETLDAVTGFLRERNMIDIQWCEPGESIITEGDEADAYYVIRLGSVKVTRRTGDQVRVLDYLKPGAGFGEIGLLSGLDDSLKEQIGNTFGANVRTASCTAVDHVELTRISGQNFKELVEAFPEVRRLFVNQAKEYIKKNRETLARNEQQRDTDMIQQGLLEAQSLLILDLERCTRCDECTKACADTHQGESRLLREGLRFDKYLVASSCRSCLDPYCLVGCPVDAIHRVASARSDESSEKQKIEIRIEDYCIGCELCKDNCPYGNITMVSLPEQRHSPTQKATTCDLCSDAGGVPRCVYACPHDAAFRISGEQLSEYYPMIDELGSSDPVTTDE